ncbi:hypothetical protein AYI68_g8340 [Smittium mucronatum]|uniref:Uncharacterized protein n=1 Tax=Smittium mucronatum TaxID=133383 RepID=A0A1R0GL65_9FUNG|nr:hypothetical protein AYI68_g8340 [Smittium mucronatum]
MSKEKNLEIQLDYLQLAAKTVFKQSPVVSAILGKRFLDLIDDSGRDKLLQTKYNKISTTRAGNSSQKIKIGKNQKPINTNASLLPEANSFGKLMCRHCGNLLVVGFTANSFRVESNSQFSAFKNSDLNNSTKSNRKKNIKKDKERNIKKVTNAQDINFETEKPFTVMDFGSRNSISIHCNLCLLESVFLCASQYKAIQISKSKILSDEDVGKIHQDRMIGTKIGMLLEEGLKKISKLKSDSLKPKELTPLEIRAAELKRAKSNKKSESKTELVVCSTKNDRKTSSDIESFICYDSREGIDTKLESSIISNLNENTKNFQETNEASSHAVESDNSKQKIPYENRINSGKFKLQNSKKVKPLPKSSQQDSINQSKNPKTTFNTKESFSISAPQKIPNINPKNNSQTMVSSKKRKSNNLASLQSLLKKKEKNQKTGNNEASNPGKYSLTDFLNTL